MSDLFIYYSRKDKEFVSRLAKAIGVRSYDVQLDRDLP